MPMRWEAPTEAAYRLAQFPPLTHRVSESRNPRIEHLLFLAPCIPWPGCRVGHFLALPIPSHGEVG